MSWETVCVQDIAEVFDGPHATPPKSDDGPIYLGIPSILPDGGIDYENSKRISYADFPKWTKRVTPRKNDVVFSYEANLESYAIIPEGFVGCLGRRMALMRPDTTKVNPRFLFYYMNSPQWKGVIAERTVLGATVNRIPIATFPQFPIELPSLNTQERIASILMAYDNLIENNRRQIALLEEAAQRLYREWFVDLRFPGHADIETIDGVPAGWRRMPVSEYAHVIKGCSYKTENIDVERGIPMVNLASIASWGGYKPFTERTYNGAYKNEQVLGTSDVVMALTEQTAGLAGYVARIPRYAEGSIPSMDLACLRPKSGARAYLYCACRYGDVSRLLSPLANGTKIKHLKPEALGYTTILVPPIELQQRFEELVNSMFTDVDILMEKSRALLVARDRLLPKLMSGEIEVEG